LVTTGKPTIIGVGYCYQPTPILIARCPNKPFF
jgi:hypothetical protein